LLGFVSLVGTAACGSRTSTLDPDVYAVAGQGGSSGVKPSSSGGKATTGSGLLGMSGGSTSPPATSSGVDPSIAVGPCQRYCAGYGTQCKKSLKGKDCLTTCQGELNDYGAFCQTQGVNALTCLTPFFSPQGGDCSVAVNRALTNCGELVTSFDACKESFAKGTKNPVSACPRSGEGGVNANCTSVYSCNNGPYITFCSPTESPMFAECGCVPPSGPLQSTRVPITGDLCFDATALCQ